MLMSAQQLHYELQSGLLTVPPAALGDTSRTIGVSLRPNSKPTPVIKYFFTPPPRIQPDIQSNG